jgi:fibronectin type 3 domain-containing protein
MRKLILTLVGICIVATGCTRQVEKPTGADDLPVAPSPATGLSISIGDGELILTWSADAEAGEVDQYMIYRSDTTASRFKLLDSAEAATYTDLDVQNGIPYYYSISVVSKSGLEGDRSRSVAAVPGVFSIRINRDAEYTSTREITVNADFPSGTSHIMLSNTAGFVGATRWIGISESVEWTLMDIDGIRSVYAKFKMQDGNESADIFSDDITLDRKAIISSLTADDGGAVLDEGDVIELLMATGEKGGEAFASIPVFGDVELFDNGLGGDAVANDGTYELDFSVPPGLEFEEGTITGNFTDAAGNQAPQATVDHTVTIRSAPQAVSLYLNGAFEDRIEVAWTMSPDEDFAGYRLYRADSQDVTTNSLLIGAFSSASQMSAEDTNVTPATTYYYRIFVSDQSGLTTASNSLQTRTAENKAPSPVVVAHEKTDSTTYKLTWTRNRDSDFESYRIYRSKTTPVTDDVGNLLTIIGSQSTTTYSGSDDGETYYYVIYVYDKFGLASEGSDVVPVPGP